jgi:outer membrane protein OmpA-like peptidoglycan-associated protein
MTNERKRKSKQNLPKAHGIAHSQEQTSDVHGALDRVKSDRYPTVKQSDLQILQQSLGNKAFRSVMANYVQRHTLPEGRQAVGEEEDEIQARREERVQRHTLPEGRQAVGEEEDEIQRSPTFGRTRPVPVRSLWGNGHAIQRDKGKGAVAPKGVDPKGADPKLAAPKGKVEAKVEDPIVKKASKELETFIGGSPYIKNNFEPDNQENYGKFDVTYHPGKKLIQADMRVKFTFPDAPVPEIKSILDFGPAAQMMAIHQMYIANFIAQVHKGWSGRFQFRNVREPQAVWGKLNPVSVKVNVTPVQANQHYTMKANLKTAGTANVSGNKFKKDPSTITLFKGDLDPTKQPNTGVKAIGIDELTRLQPNLPKVHFAAGSAKIPAKYTPDFQFIADYLKRMNRPKFVLDVVGRANKTGDEPDNLKYSTARAQAVADKLKSMGVNNHTINVKGVGSTGATKDGAWRKTDIIPQLDKGFNNVQDTTLHEFGHMLGLDDEYVRAGDTRKFTMLHKQKEMQKMLGDKGYGKGQENKYADEVSAVNPLTSASVMERGNDIRMYHYVTLWQGLYNAAMSAAGPVPPFTWKDWKVVE